MLKTRKIIIYLCPGHQHSEFVPWLLNHSPDCDHGYAFENTPDRTFDLWTAYDSSYGQGYEPKESHWHLSDNLSYLYKTTRHQPNFPVEFFEKYVPTLKGTETLYFNIPTDAYLKWVTSCRDWFETNHNSIDLKFVGHLFPIYDAVHPSRYFIKEGYILDEKFVTKDKFGLENLNSVAELKQRRPKDFQPDRTETKYYKQIQWLRLQDYVSTKNKARCEDLAEIYSSAGFNTVFNINELLSDPTIIKKVCSLPTNLEDLVKVYLDKNPPDIELDSTIKQLFKTNSNHHYRYNSDFLA